MASNKTNKSFSKRLTITKNGKVLGRRAGLNHFNAKANRSNQLDKKRRISVNIKNKSLARFMPHK